MAAFDKNRPEEFEGWDWRILQNGAISLFYRAQVLEEAIEWFQKHQYLVYTFDCAEWESETDILTRVGQTLGFPHYDNPNRDGFNDSLGDVEVPDTGGIVLAFVRFDAFAKRFPGYVQSVLDIFETNSRHFLLTGQRFIVLLQSDDPQIMFKPVGASAVMWNLKEWSSANRGLWDVGAFASSYNNPTALYDSGVINYGKQNYEKALADFSRALELDPTYYEALHYRALTYIALERHEEGLLDYDSILDWAPNDMQTLLARAQTYHKMGLNLLALADLKYALAQAPGRRDILDNLEQIQTLSNSDTAQEN